MNHIKDFLGNNRFANFGIKNEPMSKPSSELNSAVKKLAGLDRQPQC